MNAVEIAFDMAWEMIKNLPLEHQTKDHAARCIAMKIAAAAEKALREEIEYRVERIK